MSGQRRYRNEDGESRSPLVLDLCLAGLSGSSRYDKLTDYKIEFIHGNCVNQPTARRQFQKHAMALAHSLSSYLLNCPSDETSRSYVTNILTYVAKILIDEDSPQLQHYLEDLAKNVDMPGDLCKISILNAITRVSKYLWKKQMLPAGAGIILRTLIEVLEKTENPAVLKPIVEGFLYYANDEEIFTPYFRDVADILIGWYLDGSAGQDVSLFMASSLTAMAPYFLADEDFSIGFIRHFQEDISSYRSQLENGDNKITERLCSTLLIATNIAMAVQEHMDIMIDAQELINNLLEVQRILHHSPQLLKFLTEANVMCASVFVLMSECPDKVCSFLTLQFNDAPKFRIHTRYLDGLVSLIALTVSHRFDREVHMTIMTTLFSPSGALYSLRASKNVKIRANFAKVCQDVLSLKDVPLVQGAFEHLALDLKNSNPYIAFAAIEALHRMAETKDSLIALLALRPSLFELLQSLTSDSCVDERVKPEILRLLKTHATTHGHFISKSDLIGPSSSISANYLKMIVELFIRELPLGGYCSLSILKWMEELVSHAELASCVQLAQAPVFNDLVVCLSQYVSKQWKNLESEQALKILQTLLSLEGWTFETETLAEVKLLAKLGSQDELILAVLNLADNTEDIEERRDWSAADSVGFKKFMQYISGKIDTLSELLLMRLYMKNEGDGSTSVPCLSILWSWLAWQSAHHLVHGRLKSYIGKPQDSLGFIEGLLKSNLDEHRETMLLKFVDGLERCMYQAYEGTVTVNNNFDKTCRAFFRTNRNTCQEWLQRVRPLVTKLAVNRKKSQLTIWQLECFFDSKVTLNQDQINFFAAQYTRSAIDLKAPNRLLGFANFLTKNFTVSDSLGHWLKASTLHAGQKLEVALNSYEKLKLKDSTVLADLLKEQIEGCRTSLQVCDDIVNWDQDKLDMFVASQRKMSNYNLAFNAMKNFEGCNESVGNLSTMTAEQRAEFRFRNDRSNFQYSKLVKSLDGSKPAIAILSKGEVKNARSLVTLAKMMQVGSKTEAQHQWQVGMLLREACQQQQDYAKAYFKFADWSYHCGKRDIDAGDTQISAVEQKLISNILCPLNLSELVIPMCSIIGRIENCDSGHCACTSKKQKISDLLAAESIPPNALTDATEQLYAIELTMQKRVFAHYHAALDSYFQFLRLSPMGTDATQVEATLRLLRLIVKHAHSLQETLETHMSGNIVTEPWHAIIPQLFARLNHQEDYVKKTLVRLIVRIGESSLQLVAYPAIVGDRAAREDKLANIRRVNQEPSQELSQSQTGSDEDEGATLAVEELDDASKRCYAEITSLLRRDNHIKMSEIEVFVREMERISVLWEEKCIAALTQHYNQLQQPGGHQLCADLLRDLSQLTLSSAAETPHEEWFQTNFRGPITKTLETFQSTKEIDTLKKAYKSLCATINNKIQEDIQSHLSMGVISPRLASLRNTVLPVPGQVGKTVSSVANTVTVLPTKSKPKKFSLIGNDGVRYTFLFKGLEDLHLDERIMQFISISNRILSKRFGQNSYLARSYAVTPMGRRSGLIQWIDRCVPLFALYKRHQVAKQGYATRPTEMFYNKLIPKLNKANIPTDKRREWPKQMLTQVVEELMKETPGDLLLREIWASCANPEQFWVRQNALINSVAVTSMIGYIIGLGDRHLDNILVDVKSGHIIHIDYNVCFERGTQLRVAERVPFRMTPIISKALGLNGLAGGFQVAAENILRELRNNRETLLTLLEAFVYDPLVDWTVGGQANLKHLTMASHTAVRQLMDLCGDEGFRQSLLKVEQELRAIWNQLTSNVDQWSEAASKLATKASVAQALQEYPDAVSEVKTVRKQLKQLCVAVSNKTDILTSHTEIEHSPVMRLLANYFSQTTFMWSQWLNQVGSLIDAQSVQQTLHRFETKSLVSLEIINADLSYLAQQLNACNGEIHSSSVLHPSNLYRSSSPMAVRLISVVDSFKIDILPKLLALSDFEYVQSPLEPLVGEGMELLLSMVATSDCDAIAEKLEAEYERVVASSASYPAPQHRLLLELDSLFGELRFIEKLQLIHGLFSALQTVPSGASRIEAVCSVLESLLIKLIGTEDSSGIPSEDRVLSDCRIITTIMAIVQTELETQYAELPTIDSVLETLELTNEDDLQAKQDLSAGLQSTREAILEVTGNAYSTLSNPHGAIILADPDSFECSNTNELIEKTAIQVQLLQEEVHQTWQPIGLALMDADVKLQTLVDLTASVRQAECTEFLVTNAQWPQLSFNPVQVCFDTVGQFHNTCQFALRSFSGAQANTVDLQMVHEASSQIGGIYHAFEALQDRLQNFKVIDLETKKDEQCNRQGMLIWRRVKSKLEGRVHDKTKVAVGQQLEKVIHEATNIGNLALMYEGWTPWV